MSETQQNPPPQNAAAPKPQSEFPFNISVNQVFEGPLDLLLELIRKQNIDIYDIPIALITSQYLTYVERIKDLDVDVAADFIYMAALLIHIKSKMLLPRDPDAKPGDDPREELVNRLLEHQKYKHAAQMLQQKQQLEDAVCSNPNLKEFKEDEGAEAEMAADVVDLARSFREILERAKQRPVLSVNEEQVTVGQMIEYIRRRLLLEDKPMKLKKLLGNMRSRTALICTFLALLELVRLQAVLLRQDRLFGEILIKKHEMFDSVLGDNSAVRDDWR